MYFDHCDSPKALHEEIKEFLNFPTEFCPETPTWASEALRGLLELGPRNDGNIHRQSPKELYRDGCTKILEFYAEDDHLPEPPTGATDPISELHSVVRWCIQADRVTTKAHLGKPEEPNHSVEPRGKDEQNGIKGDIAIDDNELTILIELAEGSDKTFSQAEIGAATSIPRGTLKDKLPRLENIGLIHRPLGKRKGYQITDKGREVAHRNE